MRSWMWLACSLLIAATTWFYVHRIFSPWGVYVRAKETSLIAEMGDLYTPWFATRELLLRKQNPYSPEVSHEIQKAFYGHPIEQQFDKPGAIIINEQRFAYPVFVAFLLAPTMHADFSELRRAARITLALLIAASTLLSIDLVGWSPPWPVRVAICIWVLSSPQTLQGLRLEQLGLLVGFLLVLAAWCAKRNYLVLAGLCLAIACIKPQLTLLTLCFFLIWVLGQWRTRWRLPIAFASLLFALIAAGELVLPGWIHYFIGAAAVYPKYSPSFTSLFRVVFGDTGAEVIGALIVLSLFSFAWKRRTAPADSPEFDTAFSAFLIGTLLAFPLFTPFNQVLLVFPTVLLLQGWKSLPKSIRRVFAGIAIWPAITSAALLLFPPDIHSTRQWPLLPIFVPLFYPLFLPLFLMAKRARKGAQSSLTDVSLANPSSHR